MYRVVPRFDKSKVLHTTVTVDEAIHLARQESRKVDYTIAVLEGDRARVLANAGNAHWVKPCARCQGSGNSGTTPVAGYMGMFMSPTACEPCKGFGYLEDLLCG